MNIILTSDHAGFRLKQDIAAWLSKGKHKVIDAGPTRRIPGDDYPVYARKAVKQLRLHADSVGIFVCGTGVGMAIVANRHKGIRAAQAESVTTAERARQEDHANVLVLGSRIVTPSKAKKIITTFLTRRYSSAARHRRRVRQIDHAT